MEVGIDIGSLTAVASGPFRRTHQIISNVLDDEQFCGIVGGDDVHR